jgi:hypothetical protein
MTPELPLSDGAAAGAGVLQCVEDAVDIEDGDLDAIGVDHPPSSLGDVGHGADRCEASHRRDYAEPAAAVRWVPNWSA